MMTVERWLDLNPRLCPKREIWFLKWARGEGSFSRKENLYRRNIRHWFSRVSKLYLTRKRSFHLVPNSSPLEVYKVIPWGIRRCKGIRHEKTISDAIFPLQRIKLWTSLLKFWIMRFLWVLKLFFLKRGFYWYFVKWNGFSISFSRFYFGRARGISCFIIPLNDSRGDE